MQNSSETPRSSPAAADLIVRGRRVITPEGERAAAIHVRGGVIAAVSGFDEIVQGATVHEAGDLVVMPSLVDTHVHINEPGRTEWEGFSTATRAAAAGGVTTLIEMPLTAFQPRLRRRRSAKNWQRGGKTLGGCGILGRRGAGKFRRVAAAVGCGRFWI